MSIYKIMELTIRDGIVSTKKDPADGHEALCKILHPCNKAISGSSNSHNNSLVFFNRICSVQCALLYLIEDFLAAPTRKSP